MLKQFFSCSFSLKSSIHKVIELWFWVVEFFQVLFNHLVALESMWRRGLGRRNEINSIFTTYNEEGYTLAIQYTVKVPDFYLMSDFSRDRKLI